MTTGTETANVCIHFDELVDQYVTIAEDEFSLGEVYYPSIYAFDIDGEKWLTDRYWLLPERVFFPLPGEVQPTTLPDTSGKAHAAAAQWIDGLRNGELTASSAEFAATFAGVLTLAGFEAYDCGIEKRGKQPNAPHALVRDGQRVGLLMPCREANERTLSLPVPSSVLDMRKRIADTGLVRDWQAWELAARLTAGTR